MKHQTILTFVVVAVAMIGATIAAFGLRNGWLYPAEATVWIGASLFLWPAYARIWAESD
jgi:hypothetical protein